MTGDITSKIAPFEIHKYDNEQLFFLVLSDRQMDVSHQEVFSKHGWSQDGCAWSDVALQLIRSQRKELEALINFDSEAGMFLARSSSKESLETLALLMSEVFRDSEQLSKVLASAEMIFY